MKKKIMLTLMLMGCLCLCIGCGKKEKEQDQDADETEETAPIKTSEELDIQKEKDGVVLIIDESSNVTYRLYDAQFFSNIDEAGIDYSEDDLAVELLDPKESGFILMKMDVENIDHPGDDYGTINISSVIIEPRDYDEETDWTGSSPNYFVPHQEGKNFFGLSVEPGETKTCTIGFFVDTTDASKKDDYVVDYVGYRENGYVFEIPWKE